MQGPWAAWMELGGLPEVTSLLVNIQKKHEFKEALLNFPRI